MATPIDHLVTYTKGLGLGGLGGCEHAFSKSNTLAASTRYASIFHRQQGITTYLEHNNTSEVYQNLSTCPFYNYKQTLDILTTGPTNVIDEGIFEGWLKEEKEYMQSLHKEPEEKILQMECWQNLIQLQASEDDLITESKVWMPIGF
ncbi:hypothetical protein SERLA73DRAFT_149250 [Serpula lacrymans var. lacrymans S7.3]|uniref:Uncharacterized protein n=1 Tax=Serpula lacrymans var. lacrymans (strain S7.3) TaxID=936435 RepID=F8PH36_SERL3|nr:hypothetical protein SERLA73DRAFT_149250 [Serpula lacrymans var. lacrymans S7.3]